MHIPQVPYHCRSKQYYLFIYYLLMLVVLIFGHSQARNLNEYVASDVSKANFGFEVYKMLRLGVRDMADLISILTVQPRK